MVLTVHFPPSVDVLVEVFTPDSSETHMALCNVAITRCGANIVERTALLAMQPTLESKTGDSRVINYA